MSYLQTEHIEKNFGSYRALDDICLSVPQGSVFGLLGPNGAGKTTLIRLINRISLPDKGVILMDGRPMTAADVGKIGYLPEERGLYRKMKVGEQAIYLARLKGLSRYEAEQRLRQWFDKFDIASWWNRPVDELSKGMQQKVQFVVTVLHSPRLLIFDEPFSGFDPVNATLLKNEILALRDKGATVIFSTHNMSSVEEICDHIALINKSRLVLSGRVDDIRRSHGGNIYVLETCRGVAPLTLPERFTIVENRVTANNETIHVKLLDGATANDLLTCAVGQRQILSLNEFLPSMNDIFIQTVKEGGNNE